MTSQPLSPTIVSALIMLPIASRIDFVIRCKPNFGKPMDPATTHRITGKKSPCSKPDFRHLAQQSRLSGNYEEVLCRK